MKFECGDLDRALAVPELMVEAREHLRHCPECRRELRLWNEISETARQLHEDWESPDLWPRIRRELADQPRTRSGWWSDWKVWTFAASAVVAVALLIWLNRPNSFSPAAGSGARDFLTDQALSDVERTETAYRASIENLSRLASTKLQDSNSPLTAAYREKLLLLDSAINDVRTNIERNRFNASLQTELAALYREKQRTLQDVLTHDQKN